MFPTFLDTYHWYWPLDDDGEEGLAAKEAQAEAEEDDEAEDDNGISGAFDLNPCQFGVPASRSRCYTVSLSSFSLYIFYVF